MPHVTIEGPASVERFYQHFTPINIREPDAILKIQEAYLDTAKMEVLLDCLVVEDRTPQAFYMRVLQKGGKITVHLDRLTDPEKTPGVKRLIALIGQQLKSQAAACRYGPHNLAGYLLEEG